MKNWILKAAIQKTISYLPFGFRINYLFQKYITKGMRLNDKFFEDVLGNFSTFQKLYFTHRRNIQTDIRVLELGTGWQPIMPVAFFLCGAGEIYTTDLHDHLRRENIAPLMQKFIAYYDAGKLQYYLLNINADRMEVLRQIQKDRDSISVADFLKRIHTVQMIGDAAKIKLEANYFDICFSVNTLEHIYEPVLSSIIIEFRRLMKPDGFQVHALGMFDHFIHVDKSITRFHYLQFSKAQWKFIDNKIQPQNRLRIYDFRNIFHAAGLQILEEVNWEAETKLIATVKLDKQYAGQDMEQLSLFPIQQ